MLDGGVRGSGASRPRGRPAGFGRRVAVPTVRRVIVGVHGSLGSLQALRYAADEAWRRDVPLLPVTAWVPPGGDLAERRHASPYLRKLWRDDAVKRQRAAFEAGLGGVFFPGLPGARRGGRGGRGVGGGGPPPGAGGGRSGPAWAVCSPPACGSSRWWRGGKRVRCWWTPPTSRMTC